MSALSLGSGGMGHEAAVPPHFSELESPCTIEVVAC